MKLNKTHLLMLAFLVMLLCMPVLSDAQCAMCKAAVESNVKGDPNSVAKGINKGILYLMAVPYLLLAFIFRKQIVMLWKKLRGKEMPVTDEGSPL